MIKCPTDSLPQFRPFWTGFRVPLISHRGLGHTEVMTSRGVVRSWDVGGMQGVIDSADTPGGSWTSWTSVVVHGFPGLVEGQEVEFEWNQLDEPAVGYDFHTVQAWPVGEDHTPPGPPGFRAWDIDPDGTVHEVTDLDITDLDDTIAPPIGTPAIGVVTTWNGEEGWGVIDSADTPGGCWTFYSALHPDEVINARPGDSFSIGGGISALVVGEQVDFEWEPVIDQDGYKFRAIKVRPRRDIPVARRTNR